MAHFNCRLMDDTSPEEFLGVNIQLVDDRCSSPAILDRQTSRLRTFRAWVMMYFFPFRDIVTEQCGYEFIHCEFVIQIHL